MMRMAEDSRPRLKSTTTSLSSTTATTTTTTTSSGFEAENEDENDEDLENFIDGIVKELDAAEDGEDLAGLPDFKPDDLLGIGGIGAAVDAVVNMGGACAMTPPEVASSYTTSSPKSASVTQSDVSVNKNSNNASHRDDVKNEAQNFPSSSSSSSSSTSGNFFRSFIRSFVHSFIHPSFE